MEFDVLDRHTRCTGLHFLEASAGTGKTFAIEHLVVRLVLEGIPIEQILVVTFTRKATSELKLRIQRALERTREELKMLTPSSDYLSCLLEKGEAILKEKSVLIDAALICFEAAAIFTLHGFCHRMLTEFAFEGKMARLPSPDEIHPTGYYKSLARHFLLRKLSYEHYAPSQLACLLKRVKNDPERLIDRVAALLADGAAINAYPDLQEQYASFCKELSSLTPIQTDLFQEDIERLALCYKGLKKEAVLRETALWSELINKGCSKEDFKRLLKEEGSIFDAFEESNQKVKSRLPEKLHYPNLAMRLKKGVLNCLKEASCPERTLLRIARGCKMSEQAKMHLSPDQMVESLEVALEEEGFLKALQNRYRAAIIDEFQDTDPTQWAIFKRLFVGSTETLCLVGDPKQSIYAFRRADIYTYLQAKKTLGSSAHRLLNTNYRSCPSLVHALNELFAAPQGGNWLPLPRSQSTIAVRPVKAGLKEVLTEERERGRIHFFIASGKKGRGSQWPTVKMEEEQLFAFIACEIVKIKEKQNIALEEIAVLVKDRFQAERLIAHLKKQSIPASFRKGQIALDALGSFIHLVKALLYPADVSALKVALFGPLIALNESDATPRVLEAAKMQMLTLAKILQSERFGSFFHQLLNVVWPGIECSIAQGLLERGNLDLYRELQTLLERLVEEQMHTADLLSFLKCIQQEDLEVPPQEARGSLCIMTVHLSKGLEFNTVFALGVASRHTPKGSQVLKRDNTLFVLDKNESATQEALQEIDAEKMRLLYVALTRAKEQLYIPLALEEEAKGAQELSPIELFFAKIGQEPAEMHLLRLAAKCSLSYEKISWSSTSFQAEVPPLLIQPPPIDFLPESTYFTSFSALAASLSKANFSITFGIEEAFPDERLPLGAKTGVILHAIFETIFKKCWHHPFNRQEIIAFIDKTDLAQYRETVFSLVTEQLHLELLPGFTLIDLAAGTYVQEQEFLYLTKDGMIKGVADLWFIYQDKYYLLDWKSNSLATYSQESMEKAMRDHDYFLQGSIYAAALKRYVKLFDNRPFGAAFYLFVRGNGVYHFIPEDL